MQRAAAWRLFTPRQRAARRDGEDPRVLLAQVAAALALSIAGGAAIAVTGDWLLAFVLLGGMAFLALGMLQPALFLIAVLLVRPLLDGRGAPNQLMGVVLIAICVLLLVSRSKLMRPGATPAFFALLIVSALACLPAYLEFPAVIGTKPIGEIVRLAALFAIYVLAAHVVTSTDGMRRIFVLVGLSGVLPAISAINELINNPDRVASLGLVRVSGTFVNPVALSSYLAISTLVLLSLPREDLARKYRWPALALMTVALVASYGREGWVVLLLAIVLLHWRRNKRIIVRAAVICAVMLVAVPGVSDRVLPSEEPGRAQADSGTFASYHWRLANWRGLLEQYGKRPLTGWGLETTQLVNPRRTYGLPGQSTTGFKAHNGAVRALVEGGILLLVAVLALFAALIRTLQRIVRARDSPLRPYARVVLAAWIAVFVVAMTTDDLLNATALVYALLAMTGALEGARRWSARAPAAAA